MHDWCMHSGLDRSGEGGRGVRSCEVDKKIQPCERVRWAIQGGREGKDRFIKDDVSTKNDTMCLRIKTPISFMVGRITKEYACDRTKR